MTAAVRGQPNTWGGAERSATRRLHVHDKPRALYDGADVIADLSTPSHAMLHAIWVTGEGLDGFGEGLAH